MRSWRVQSGSERREQTELFRLGEQETLLVCMYLQTVSMVGTVRYLKYKDVQTKKMSPVELVMLNITRIRKLYLK